MTATATLDRPTVESDLDQARRALAAVHDRIASGDQVQGAELADAEQDVRVAEMRLAALDQQEAAAAAQHHAERRRDFPADARNFQAERDEALRTLLGQVTAHASRFVEAVVDLNDRGYDLIDEAEQLGHAKPHGVLVDPYQPLIEAILQALDSNAGRNGMALYDPTNTVLKLRDLRPPKGSPAQRLAAGDND